MFKEIIIAGCGGFAGTAARYIVGRCTGNFWQGSFPLGTFVVNILGCFLIGLFFGLLEHAKVLNPNHIILLVTGFCGGFTTFSAFANEIWMLGSKGEWFILTLYLSLSVILGVLCVWGGRALIR